jgi:hypothetical protein
MRNSASLLVIPVLFLFGCSGNSKNTSEVESSTISKSDTVEIQHFNVIFAGDLSNRIVPEINPKPIDDTQIISDFLENIELILNFKRSTDQFDKFSFDIVNRSLVAKYSINPDLMKIDFAKFGTNQMERIQYLKNTGHKKLEDDLKVFHSELLKTYEFGRTDNNGADLYAYLDGFNELNLEKGPKPFVYQKVAYKSTFKNILILLTDGYIEAGFYGENACRKNLCYYLSSNKIVEFRENFMKSGETDFKEFFKQEGYGIVPLQNEALKEFEILVLEVDDRSLDNSGNTTIKPTDFEIIKLFWEDWFEKSGIERFKIVPISTSRENVEKEILSFLEVVK